MFMKKLKKIKHTLLASLLLIGFSFAKPNNGISLMYLFDVSRSFHKNSLPSSIKTADKIFKSISNKNSGIVFPQTHQVSTIDDQSVTRKQQCFVEVVQSNIFKKVKVPPDFTKCLEEIKSSNASNYTDIDGALLNASRSLRGDEFYGKGIIIFSDLHEDVPIKKEFEYNLDGVSIFVVHALSNKQIKNAKLSVDDENKIKQTLIDHGVNKDAIFIGTLESITTNPGQVKNFFRKSFKNNR